ncbi:MAG: SCO6745 family protein [Acidimicrobiales bacterium]
MPSPPLTPARLLAATIEPIAGQAQFSPECHANYATLGFAPNSGFSGKTSLPDRSAFFTARGSVLGQVPGTVVAAAFAVFNPAVVVPLVEEGWTRTAAATIWAARQSGAVAQLHRLLGPTPEGARDTADVLLEATENMPLPGRMFFSAQRALDVPDEPVARLWRAADRLRECRGDAHIIAWNSEGLDATEIGLLGDLYWGLAPRSHTAGRGWSADQLAAAEDRLRSRGLLGGEVLTAQGFELRDRIEQRTDELMAPAIGVLGDRLERIVAQLRPWRDTIVDAGGYLSPAVRFTFDLP